MPRRAVIVVYAGSAQSDPGAEPTWRARAPLPSRLLRQGADAPQRRILRIRGGAEKARNARKNSGSVRDRGAPRVARPPTTKHTLPRAHQASAPGTAPGRAAQPRRRAHSWRRAIHGYGRASPAACSLAALGPGCQPRACRLPGSRRGRPETRGRSGGQGAPSWVRTGLPRAPGAASAPASPTQPLQAPQLGPGHELAAATLAEPWTPRTQD